jgi:hypothetical protein
VIDAYPLTWPVGWKRTPAFKRRRASFGTRGRGWVDNNGRGEWHGRREITVAGATQRILDELRRFGVSKSSIVISSNLRVRLDGLPHSKQSQPSDPGACVYFKLDGRDRCVPCDTYAGVAENLAGIAATLEALRALERHGSGLMERAFTGFEALPHLPAEQTPDWWEVLGVEPWDSLEVIEEAYKRVRSVAHPDKGGSAVEFDQVQRAYDDAIAEVTAR